jgi:ABC-type tungstate transport system substrate-binding protein
MTDTFLIYVCIIYVLTLPALIYMALMEQDEARSHKLLFGWVIGPMALPIVLIVLFLYAVSKAGEWLAEYLIWPPLHSAMIWLGKVGTPLLKVGADLLELGG